MRSVPPPPTLNSGSPKPVPAVTLDMQIQNMHTELKGLIISESSTIRGELRAVCQDTREKLDNHEGRLVALEQSQGMEEGDGGQSQRMWEIQCELMRQDQRINSGELALSNVKVTQIQLKTTMGAMKKENKDLNLPTKETRIVNEGRTDMCILQFDNKASAAKFKDAWIKKKPTNPDSSLIYVRYAKSQKHRAWSSPLDKAATAIRKFLHEQKAEFGETSVSVDWLNATVKVGPKSDKKDKKTKQKHQTNDCETAATMCVQTYSISLEPKFAGAQAFL